jgi:hypothetical protein
MRFPVLDLVGWGAGSEPSGDRTGSKGAKEKQGTVPKSETGKSEELMGKEKGKWEEVLRHFGALRVHVQGFVLCDKSWDG